MVGDDADDGDKNRKRLLELEEDWLDGMLSEIFAALSDRMNLRRLRKAGVKDADAPLITLRRVTQEPESMTQLTAVAVTILGDQKPRGTRELVVELTSRGHAIAGENTDDQVSALGNGLRKYKRHYKQLCFKRPFWFLKPDKRKRLSARNTKALDVQQPTEQQEVTNTQPA